MGPFASFLTSILLQNRQKNEGWTLWRYLRKKSHKAEKNLHKKILVMAGLEPMSFCLSDLEKAVVDRWQWSSVTQFSVSVVLVPTYKIYKICQFVGLKKKEVTTIVCVFLRKAPTKKPAINFFNFWKNTFRGNRKVVLVIWNAVKPWFNTLPELLQFNQKNVVQLQKSCMCVCISVSILHRFN